jgi:pimeloyl-ACP methyl ester carboxylesterase
VPQPDRFAYLHGFASGPWSAKGRLLVDAFAARGTRLHLPDLNLPSFASLSHDAMLAGVDELDASLGAGRRLADGAWGLIGSSMGGWLAARWAELHPERVARLVLLAPGLDLPQRWREVISPAELAAWERRGWIEGPRPGRESIRLHWGFMEEARRQPPLPEPRCPTLILHGSRDTVVPLAVSESFARSRPHVTLEALDDNHDLLVTFPRILARITDWFGLGND